MLTIGAHVSITGGYEKALERASSIGATCAQMFSASPRIWSTAGPKQSTPSRFLEAAAKLSISPLYFHATYLINLASDGKIAELSKQTLIRELQLASDMNVAGSVIHLGSYKDTNGDMLFDQKDALYKKMIENIQHILTETPSNTLFIIENAGNRKIGRTIEELGSIVKDVQSHRIKICLDTCHLHAAGYSLETETEYESFLETFDQTVGLHNLALIHLNDSKDKRGSYRDRHENIGRGQIPQEVFIHLLTDKRLNHIPFILEVPGYDKKGPDKQNVDYVKQLVSV